MITQAPPQDTAILSRLFDVAPQELSGDLARFLLTVKFDESDRTRMQELAGKAREGELSEDEQTEIDSYERVGHVLNILQAKARVRLQRTTDRT